MNDAVESQTETLPTPEFADAAAPPPGAIESVAETAIDADAQAKTDARIAFRMARRALAPDVRKKANKAILAKLVASKAFARAKTILIYAAAPHEVNLDDLIAPLTRAGKKIALPRMTKTPGVMTLWVVRHVDALIEAKDQPVRTPDVTRAIPIEPKDIDLVLVPGVAFTATLGRLGQGGGYYDRLLTRLRKDATWIGVGFDVQLAQSLPIADHDVTMHAVVTEIAVFGDAEMLEFAPPVVPPGALGANPAAQISPLEGEISMESAAETDISTETQTK